MSPTLGLTRGTRVGGWGEGGSQRKLPAAPSRTTRSGRDTATSASGERAAVLLQRPWWGECLGTRPGWGGSTGPGARAGGRSRAQGAAGPRLTLQEYATISQSMNLPAPPSWRCARAHGSTHNSLISTIFPEHLHSCRRYHRRYHHRHFHRRRYRHLLRLRGPASLTTEPPLRLRFHTLPPRRGASARARS